MLKPADSGLSMGTAAARGFWSFKNGQLGTVPVARSARDVFCHVNRQSSVLQDESHPPRRGAEAS